MPSLKASQRSETGLTSRSSGETTSLISHGQDAVQYGWDGSNAGGRVKAKGPGSCEEERPLLPSEATQLASLQVLGTLARSSLDWVRGSLAGGWSDHVSLRLQNSGSVARDHLALERTFLAYIRTSLAIASAGVALVQLFSTSSQVDGERSQMLYRPLGASVIVVGLIVLAIGLVRYFVVQAALVKGVFPVARLGVVFIGVILTLLITAVYAILATRKLEFDGL